MSPIDPDYDISFLFENDRLSKFDVVTFTDREVEVDVVDEESPNGGYVAAMDITFQAEVSWVDDPASFDDPGGIYDVTVNGVNVVNLVVKVDPDEVVVTPDRFIRRDGDLVIVKPNAAEFAAARAAFDIDSVAFDEAFSEAALNYDPAELDPNYP